VVNLSKLVVSLGSKVDDSAAAEVVFNFN
jgi:hypothetical protein